MDLILKVVEGPNGAEWRGLQARFDASGGLIGRAETARLSLPDSTRTVSRFHAHVSCSGETYFLEEMGSRNTATVNGKAVKAGSKEALRPGDKVRIGHFTLAVDFDDPDFPATQVMERRSLRLEAGEDEDSTQVVVREGFRPRPSNSTAQLLDAFQDGAGIEIEVPADLQPEFMRTLGQMLRVLLGGIQRLSSQRMRLRNEASPDQSHPGSRHVDPIRAAAEEVRFLTALLKPGAIGSDEPHTRAQEMVDELAARLTAMRIAVETAVEKTEAMLAPAALEAQMPASLFLDELLPMRRKARLWDLYRRIHASDEAARSVGDSGDRSGLVSAVRGLFNNAFKRAYEAELVRLRKSRL